MDERKQQQASFKYTSFISILFGFVRLQLTFLDGGGGGQRLYTVFATLIVSCFGDSDKYLYIV